MQQQSPLTIDSGVSMVILLFVRCLLCGVCDGHTNIKVIKALSTKQVTLINRIRDSSTSKDIQLEMNYAKKYYSKQRNAPVVHAVRMVMSEVITVSARTSNQRGNYLQASGKDL